MISFGSCIYPTLGSVKVSPSRVASPENYQHQTLKVSGVTPRPELPSITLCKFSCTLSSFSNNYCGLFIIAYQQQQTSLIMNLSIPLSFKETVPVLEEHEEALKQLQQTHVAYASRKNLSRHITVWLVSCVSHCHSSTQQHSALQKYRDIWATYQAKYESSDKCKELLMAREKLNLLQRRG